MQGASVVYHCANPRYHSWAKELLPLGRGIRAGAARNGARLVVLDNLYGYRVPADGRLAEDTEVAPRSKKGALRAAAAEELLAAHAAGEVKVAIARASDFMGPGVYNSLLGERLFPKLMAGRSVSLIADPDQPHSYSFAPDVAAGLATLGLAGDDAYGRVWHLPALPAETTRAWIDRFAAAFGHPAPRITTVGPWLMHLAGLFVPEAGELPEMMYQWQAPFRLDDQRFREAFGAAPTPLEEVVRATVAWARATWGKTDSERAAA
jgi:nucleoside-diphosphate-sugar epimerase